MEALRDCDVLVIEGDTAERGLIVELLMISELSAIGVASRSEALDLLASGLRPRLIILNLFRLGDAARKFLESFRADVVDREIPIVVTTTSEPIDLPVRAILRKPIDMDELLRIAWATIRNAPDGGMARLSRARASGSGRS
jgi:CheY-like chemotaxis protein